jgi:dCMP deaminase
MPPQIDLDKSYIKMAHIWAQLSKANRKKVGCLIVKDGMIISDGYNGTPKGFDNSCETSIMPKSIAPKDLGEHPLNALVTKPEVLHAESNAITKLAKSTQSSKKATVYVTISPCIDCAKLIVQSEINRVVYGELYKDDNGINLLKKASIEVEQCSI